MPADIWIALILTLPSLIGAVTSAVALVLGLTTRQKLDRVHADTNGRLSQLLESTRRLAYAEGLIEGKRQQSSTPGEPPCA